MSLITSNFLYLFVKLKKILNLVLCFKGAGASGFYRTGSSSNRRQARLIIMYKINQYIFYI